MSYSAQIQTALTLSLVVPGDEPLPVDASLSYEIADPYAVHLDIAAGDGIVRWSFARELLTTGVDEPAGDGDVRIIPLGGRDGRRVRIQLSSPDGAAMLEAPLAEMVEFLGATFDAVPTGTESDHLDVDALVAHLLAG
jgi:sporulation and cell division protein SsgA